MISKKKKSEKGFPETLGADLFSTAKKKRKVKV